MKNTTTIQPPPINKRTTVTGSTVKPEKPQLMNLNQINTKVDCLQALQDDLQGFINNLKFCRDNENSYYAKVRLVELTKISLDLKGELFRLQQQWEVQRNKLHKDPLEDHFNYIQTQMDWFS